MNPAAEDGWVLTREAVRVIARLDGETLRSAADIPPKAEVKLIEAARAGRIRGRGVRYTTGELEEIPARDWHMCDADVWRGALREPQRRLPRFTDIEIRVADLMREFPARSAAQPTAQVKDAPADFEAHKKTVLEVLLAAQEQQKGS